MMAHALPGTRGRRRIYLMRHGEVSYHRTDGRTVFANEVELTDEGVAQARLMGEMLADIPLDLAFHTGLCRTRRSAELVLGDRDVPLEEIGDLREMQGGSIEKLSETRLEAEFVYGMERAALPGANFAGGETFVDFRDRVVPAFEGLLLRPGWKTALVVAHGGTNAMILSWVVRAGLAGMAAFEQDAGCVNIIDADVLDGEVLRRFIRSINLTPYNYSKRDHYLTVTERIVGSRLTPLTAPARSG